MNGQVLLFLRKIGPQAGARIIEIGSLDVNGSPRETFKAAAEYVGIDFRPGLGVDLVMNAEQVHENFPAGYFDTVLCCETLEHCENWKEVVRSMWAILKTNGKCVITTPTRKKGRHNYPNDYWRWELDDYKKMFAAQNIIRCEPVGTAGIGVIVEKVSDELDLEVTPHQIPPPKK